MDEERERQQRDLQRATELLETMSREELVDMLHDILFNERSDDTRKLSDWMAFQIILQDETRDARRLLAQLGKVSAARLRVLQDLDQVHWSSESPSLLFPGPLITTGLLLVLCWLTWLRMDGTTAELKPSSYRAPRVTASRCRFREFKDKMMS